MKNKTLSTKTVYYEPQYKVIFYGPENYDKWMNYCCCFKTLKEAKSFLVKEKSMSHIIDKRIIKKETKEKYIYL